jgi:hypothetical protein
MELEKLKKVKVVLKKDDLYLSATPRFYDLKGH